MTPAVNTMAGRRTLWLRGLLIGLVAGMLLFAGVTGVPAAEPHRDVTGTTVILHGFQFSGTVPDWTFYMAEAIRLRAGGGGLAGWVFHGGGGTGQLADDGDPYLRLAAGQSMIHNRLLVPRDAIGMRFCRRVFVPGAGDLLRVTLHQDSGSRTLHREDPASASDWRCFYLALETGEGNEPSTLEISVFDDGSPPAAEIGIDDQGFRVGIFIDGFESGDSSSWSSQNP